MEKPSNQQIYLFTFEWWPSSSYSAKPKLKFGIKRRRKKNARKITKNRQKSQHSNVQFFLLVNKMQLIFLGFGIAIYAFYFVECIFCFALHAFLLCCWILFWFVHGFSSRVRVRCTTEIFIKELAPMQFVRVDYTDRHTESNACKRLQLLTLTNQIYAVHRSTLFSHFFFLFLRISLSLSCALVFFHNIHVP